MASAEATIEMNATTSQSVVESQSAAPGPSMANARTSRTLPPMTYCPVVRPTRSVSGSLLS